METAQESREGLYIYGIVNAAGTLDFGPVGIGGREDVVYGVRHRDIAAVVSRSLALEYEPRRVNMIAHEKVLEAVMASHALLPVRFSTVSPGFDDARVAAILEEDYPRLRRLLSMMEGKREMGLKVVADEAKMYEGIVSRHDDIRTLRDRLIGLPPEKTHYQRVRIGELVGAALEKEKDAYREAVLEALTPVSEEVKVNDSYGSMMVLNAAFLIMASREAEFDRAVEELDARYQGMLTFRYAGNLPPYNFVNISINLKGV